jgi:hypothetical protein
MLTVVMKLVSMVSTHGKTPEEMADELIAAVQKFREAGAGNATAVSVDTPEPRGPDTP